MAMQHSMLTPHSRISTHGSPHTLSCFSSRHPASSCRYRRSLATYATSRHDALNAELSRRSCMLLGLCAAFQTGVASAQVPTQQAEGTTLVVPVSAVPQLDPSERQVYKLNKRIQTQNRLMDNFPVFVREGFNVKIIADDFNTSPEGLIYSVIQEGKGTPAKDGQQVVFEYVGYNESGSLIDSSYRQGKPAEATLGIGGVIPGFEIALKSMPPGSKWRVIIPPELGPPVGPSTFFSAKQCEVFDINVLDIKNCSRKPMLMFSQLVCE